MSGSGLNKRATNPDIQRTQSGELWLYLEATTTVNVNYIALSTADGNKSFLRWGLMFGQWEKTEL